MPLIFHVCYREALFIMNELNAYGVTSIGALVALLPLFFARLSTTVFWIQPMKWISTVCIMYLNHESVSALPSSRTAGTATVCHQRVICPQTNYFLREFKQWTGQLQ